jgi:ABC-2 type transport system permease protein
MTMKNEIKKYFRLWLFMTVNSFQISLANRFAALMFLLGKALRFGFFLVFLTVVLGQTKTLGSYTSTQVLIFFLTFNVIDTGVQLVFREVYRFRPLVVSGDFDLILEKPIHPLFRVMAGGADSLDLIMLIPYVALLLMVSARGEYLTLTSIVLFSILLINGFIIATAFHVLVIAVTILTSEIDQAVMIYRDISSLGRFPIDLYRQPISFLMTFVIPIAAMMTLPAKALMGLFSFQGLIYSFFFTILIFWLSLKIWKKALREYSSASS